MADHDTLEDLLTQVALGNRAAFQEVYERTSAKLFGVCLRLLSERAIAEEVLQEAYVKVWRNAGSYVQAKAKPMTWLIAVARNQAIDRLRVQRPGAVDLEEAGEIRDEKPSPELAAIASDERERLHDCMDTLGAKHSDVIRSAYFGGFSYGELAENRGVPLGTMKSWIRRSLLKLKDCLEQ